MTRSAAEHLGEEGRQIEGKGFDGLDRLPDEHVPHDLRRIESRRRVEAEPLGGFHEPVVADLGAERGEVGVARLGEGFAEGAPHGAARGFRHVLVAATRLRRQSFDGRLDRRGRVVTALSPWLWLVGIVIIGFLMLTHFNVLLLLIFVFSLPRVFSLFRPRSQEQLRYFQVTPAQRRLMAALYLGLVAFLVVGMKMTESRP